MLADTNEDEDNREPVRTSISDKTAVLRWSGEVPAQKWMNFYTKVLSRFATTKSLRLTVAVDVAPDGRRFQAGDRGNQDRAARARPEGRLAVAERGRAPRGFGSVTAYDEESSRFSWRLYAVRRHITRIALERKLTAIC